MPKKQGNKPGRKKWIPDEEALKAAHAMATRGLTMDQIARCLGICPDLLYRQKRANKDFAEALKNGLAVGIHNVANKLYEAAMQGEAWAICFFLKSRAGWSEQSEGAADDDGYAKTIDFTVAQNPAADPNNAGGPSEKK